MSRTKTLAQLRSLVENQADIVGASARYSPTLLNGLINQSVQRFRERVSIEGSTRYLTQTSGTLTVGAASGLPFQVIELGSVTPAVVRTFGVDLTINGTILTLEHRPFEERTKFGTQPSQPIAWAPYGDKVAILPPPVGAYPYTIWYLPLLADMTAESDTFDGVAGWEDFVVWDVFQRVATRDTYEKVFQQASIVKDQIIADIVRGATKVSHAGGAHRGRDTFGVGGLAGLQKRPLGGGGSTAPAPGSVTNSMLAAMAARTIKGNFLYASASPQDLTSAQAADLLPSFAGAAGGLVPTGAGNSALFLNNAGGWTSPSVGGSVTGLALSQLGDIHAPRVIGLFGIPTGAPTLLSGQHVASMIGVFTGSAHGLVPYPSGGLQNFVLRDDGAWVAQTGGGGGGPTMLAKGGSGALQYNGGSGFAGASGIFTDGTRLRFTPSGALSGLIGVPNNVAAMVGRNEAGNNDVAMLSMSTEDRVFFGDGNQAKATVLTARDEGFHDFWFNNSSVGLLNQRQLRLGAGMRLGMAQLAVPDTVGDKLGSWTASGFANHATGINISASGMRLSVGSGGPQLHASGIDLRSGDIRNVRRLNNLDGIKVYGDLPDANTDVNVASGTVFLAPFSASQGRIYTLVPTGAQHGDVVLLENRSAHGHSIYNAGTGLGAPSGWIATLSPSGGLSARFASGAWEYGSRYQLGGF